MENTSKLPAKSDREIFYYRQRYKNRIHEAITAFFAEEAERRGLTKQDIAEAIHRDPAQVSRWLNAPSNLTLDTISDLLLSMDAEMDCSVARFEERGRSNHIHPLVAAALDASLDSQPVIRVNRKNSVDAETDTGARIRYFESEE